MHPTYTMYQWTANRMTQLESRSNLLARSHMKCLSAWLQSQIPVISTTDVTDFARLAGHGIYDTSDVHASTSWSQFSHIGCYEQNAPASRTVSILRWYDKSLEIKRARTAFFWDWDFALSRRPAKQLRTVSEAVKVLVRSSRQCKVTISRESGARLPIDGSEAGKVGSITEPARNAQVETAPRVPNSTTLWHLQHTSTQLAFANISTQLSVSKVHCLTSTVGCTYSVVK